MEINIVRNLSAHHSRIWNRKFSDIAIPKLDDPRWSKFKKMQQYFPNLSLDDKARKNFRKGSYSVVLVSQTSTILNWLDKFEDLLNDFPNFTEYKSRTDGI